MSKLMTTILYSIDIPTDGDTAYLKFVISYGSARVLHTISVHKKDAEEIVHIVDAVRLAGKEIGLPSPVLSPECSGELNL